MGFMIAWHAYKMALILDIPTLESQLLGCLKSICSDQVSAMDCREIFISTDPDRAKFRDDVAESTAKANFEGRLIEKTIILMFCSEGPDFDDAITNFSTLSSLPETSVGQWRRRQRTWKR